MIYTIGLVLVICFLDFFIKKRFLWKYAKNSKTAPYLPIIGSVFLLIGQGNDFAQALFEQREKLKSSYFFWFFHRPCYYSANPDEIKIILTNSNTLEKGSAYKFFNGIIRNSLLIAEVPLWKKNRKIVSKCFSQSQLDSYIHISNRLIDEFIEKNFKSKTVTALVEKNERFFLTNFLETVCNFSFERTSIDLSTFNNADLYYIIKTVHCIVMSRLLKPYLYPEFIFRRTAKGKEMRELHKKMEGTIKQATKEKITLINNNIEPEYSEKKTMYLGDALQQYSNRRDWMAEFKLFVVAAAETTGNSMAVTLSLIGMHPEVQEKMYQEILNVVGTDGVIEHHHLPELKYTEMVIMESLRIFPPVPIIFRKTTCDINLGDKIIPKGMDVFVGILGVHRFDKYFENPMEFRPERFSKENTENVHPYSFLPFSAGPRNCIGAKYAMMILKAIIAKIVLKYKISSTYKNIEDIKFKTFFLISFTDDLGCEFEPR